MTLTEVWRENAAVAIAIAGFRPCFIKSRDHLFTLVICHHLQHTAFVFA
jgi:hypothetical protein